MGCSLSKHAGRRRRRSWGSMQPATTSPADRRLAMALKDLKQKMDEEHSSEVFTFTKIILKLGTIERVLRRVKAVFRSVDHGNKGHVTKDELKEGLHKAKVDLGEEWEDTNIDDCLEHLGDGESDPDRVGIREFVVMLAVGRVCRPLKQRSSVLVPLDSGLAWGRNEDASGQRAQRHPHPPAMGTIDENESRKASLASTEFTIATQRVLAEAAANTTQDASGAPSPELVDSVLASAADAAEDQNCNGNVGGTRGLSDSGSDGVGDGVLHGADRHAAASMSDDEGAPRASAGPGGLPRVNSWRNLRWARIPTLRSIDLSGRSTQSIPRSRADSGYSKQGLSKTSSGDSSGGAGREADMSLSVKYVLDLFIAAYFQFDTKGQGYIKKSVVEKNLRQAVRESGTSALLDSKRWSELAWDGDRLSFQEFIYAFAQWLGLPEDDDDDYVPVQAS